MWYNIAGANGSESAREQRDTIEDDMTNAQDRACNRTGARVHGLGLREL